MIKVETRKRSSQMQRNYVRTKLLEEPRHMAQINITYQTFTHLPIWNNQIQKYPGILKSLSTLYIYLKCKCKSCSSNTFWLEVRKYWLITSMEGNTLQLSPAQFFHPHFRYIRPCSQRKFNSHPQILNSKH